jgi:cell division protein FtsZ
VDEAANRIREEVDPEANIIFGSTFDEKLAGRMRISVVATGIEAETAQEQARPAAALRTEPVLRETGSGYTQPVLTQNAATPAAGRTEPARPDLRTEPRADGPAEPVPAAAEAAESAAVRSGAFIAPKPADPGAVRPVPLAQPAVPPSSQPRPKSRAPSLIERVTGIGRARHNAAAAPGPRPLPAAAKPGQQPRLTPLEPDQKPGASKEDDLLDIPAFLRRQAN